MVITRNLINNFFSLDKISDLDIVTALNSLGYEVEKCEKLIDNNNNIVLGKVLDYVKIEGSNKLNLAKVQINKKDIVDIVCGASNLEVDMYVVVALPGATLSNDIKIKKASIFGCESSGMLCSFSELGYKSNPFISDKGIIKITGEFASDKYLGEKNILELIKLNDTIFDYDITLNRSYGLSFYEVIKELALYFKKTIKTNSFDSKSELKFNNKIKNNIGLDLKGLSTAVVEVNKNIEKLDIKFTNLIKMLNITSKGFDSIGEFIALKTGQPLILLDADKIENDLILSNDKSVKENQTLKDLTITHNDKIVSLIGIQDYNPYEVSKNTKKILIISAYFNSDLIRKQQKKYSSKNIKIQRYMRFNTGSRINDSIKNFIEVLKKNDLLVSYSNIVENKKVKENKKNITLSLTEIINLIGQDISLDNIKSILLSLGFGVNINNDILVISIPEIRYNLKTHDDLIEEIIRIYGYDNIKSKPYINSAKYISNNDIDKKKETVNNILLVNNFFESKTFSLVKKTENESFNIFNYKNPITLTNPLNNLHEEMRLHLLKSLINVAEYNINHQQKNIKTFTLENVYHNLNKSNLHLAAIVCGDLLEHKISNSKINNTFYYLKGIFTSILSKFNIPLSEINFEVTELHGLFHPYQSAKILYKNIFIGYIGAINPKFNPPLVKNIFGLEINLDSLLNSPYNKIKYIDNPKNNPICRDVTIISEENYQNIIQKITKNIINIQEISFKDYYIDENKNICLTISFVFNDNNNQLQNKDVNLEFEKILFNIKESGLKIKS